MKPMIEDLKPGQTVTSFFRLLAISQREAKNKSPYLAMTLGDRTGQIEAKRWGVALNPVLIPGSIVKIKGIVEEYQGAVQINVEVMRFAVSDDDKVDEADLYECSPYPIDKMWEELRYLIEENCPSAGIYQEIINFILDQNEAAIKIVPAAQKVHHAYRGGLLEHIRSLVMIIIDLPLHYNQQYGLKLDLLIAIACLHDIGKVRELQPDGAGYTTEGSLMGHIVIGIEMVNEACRNLSFPPDDDARLKSLEQARVTLVHCIASHHGSLEFGSPVLPQIPEAIAFHWLDQLDARMNICWSALKKAKGDSAFTERQFFLGQAPIFRGFKETNNAE